MRLVSYHPRSYFFKIKFNSSTKFNNSNIIIQVRIYVIWVFVNLLKLNLILVEGAFSEVVPKQNFKVDIFVSLMKIKIFFLLICVILHLKI